VTDRCNLRCSYCIPAEGLDWLPSPALPTDGEMTRLIAIAVQRLGITEVRFTGGEVPARNGLDNPPRPWVLSHLGEVVRPQAA
jgi:GTP 3',8-cyclase